MRTLPNNSELILANFLYLSKRCKKSDSSITYKGENRGYYFIKYFARLALVSHGDWCLLDFSYFGYRRYDSRGILSPWSRCLCNRNCKWSKPFTCNFSCNDSWYGSWINFWLTPHKVKNS